MVHSQIFTASQNPEFSLRPRNRSQIRNRVGSTKERGKFKISKIFDSPDQQSIKNVSFKRKLSENTHFGKRKGGDLSGFGEIKEEKESQKSNSSVLTRQEHKEVIIWKK